MRADHAEMGSILVGKREVLSRHFNGLWCVLQCVAVCCRVVQCVAVCCSVLQCAAVCYSVLQCVAIVSHCVVVCCSVLQGSERYSRAISMGSGVAMWRGVLHCVAVCCSVLQ